MKDNTFYSFTHKCNARNSEQLLAVRMRHGVEGYGVYYMILEMLAESPLHTCLKDYNLVAFELRTSAGVVKSVVENFGLFLFTEDGERFYSEELRPIEPTLPKSDLSDKRRQAARKRWGKAEGDAKSDLHNANSMQTDAKPILHDFASILHSENGKKDGTKEAEQGDDLTPNNANSMQNNAKCDLHTFASDLHNAKEEKERISPTPPKKEKQENNIIIINNARAEKIQIPEINSEQPLDAEEEKKKLREKEKSSESDYFAEMKAPSQWQEAICMMHHIATQDFGKLIDTFQLQCRCSDKADHPSLAEAKRHFDNWIRKFKSSEQNIKQDADIKTNRQDRRRGVFYEAGKPKDYETTF